MTTTIDAPLQKFVFDGDNLDVLHQEDRVLIAVRRVCDALGVDLASQSVKLRSKGWACVVMNTTQLPGDTQRREHIFLDLRSLPMWLATIEPSRVAEHVRPKLLRYQRECADVLADHFLGRRAQSAPLDKRVTDLEELAVTFARTIASLTSVVEVTVDTVGALADKRLRRAPAARPAGRQPTPEAERFVERYLQISPTEEVEASALAALLTATGVRHSEVVAVLKRRGCRSVSARPRAGGASRRVWIGCRIAEGGVS